MSLQICYHLISNYVKTLVTHVSVISLEHRSNTNTCPLHIYEKKVQNITDIYVFSFALLGNSDVFYTIMYFLLAKMPLYHLTGPKSGGIVRLKFKDIMYDGCMIAFTIILLELYIDTTIV